MAVVGASIDQDNKSFRLPSFPGAVETKQKLRSYASLHDFDGPSIEKLFKD